MDRVLLRVPLGSQSHELLELGRHLRLQRLDLRRAGVVQRGVLDRPPHDGGVVARGESRPPFRKHSFLRVPGPAGIADAAPGRPPIHGAYAGNPEESRPPRELNQKVPILVNRKGLIEPAALVDQASLEQKTVERNVVLAQERNGIVRRVVDPASDRRGVLQVFDDFDAAVRDPRLGVALQRGHHRGNVLRMKPVIVIKECDERSPCIVQSGVGSPRAIEAGVRVIGRNRRPSRSFQRRRRAGTARIHEHDFDIGIGLTHDRVQSFDQRVATDCPHDDRYEWRIRHHAASSRRRGRAPTLRPFDACRCSTRPRTGTARRRLRSPSPYMPLRPVPIEHAALKGAKPIVEAERSSRWTPRQKLVDDDRPLGAIVEGHLVGMSTAGLRHRRVRRAAVASWSTCAPFDRMSDDDVGIDVIEELDEAPRYRRDVLARLAVGHLQEVDAL